MKKHTALVFGLALFASFPAYGQLRHVTDGPQGISYNAASKTVSGAYTATKDDHTILANAAAAAFTITLPAPSSRAYPYLVIKKTDASNNAVSTLVLGSQYQQVVLHADATEFSAVPGRVAARLEGDSPKPE